MHEGIIKNEGILFNYRLTLILAKSGLSVTPSQESINGQNEN